MKKLKKLITKPKAFFIDAKANKEMLVEAANGTRDVIFALHINKWKRIFIEKLFANKKIIYLPFNMSEKRFRNDWAPLIQKSSKNQLLVWGKNIPSPTLGLNAVYVEDGFFRSVDIGANHASPLSLNFDSMSPYFDATKETDLERLLNNSEFDAELLERSKKIISYIVENGLSKYNHLPYKGVNDYTQNQSEKKVLVIGQVEHDASIIYGCAEKITNEELLTLACKENPDSIIYYKPHPDVLAGKRKGSWDYNNGQKLNYSILPNEISIADSLIGIDHLYTITSQVGLEALLRGIKVTVLGAPFYAGWGLTDDRQVCRRRKRKLTIEELAAGSLIKYPVYFNPNNGSILTPEEALINLKNMRDLYHYEGSSVRLLYFASEPVSALLSNHMTKH